MTAEIAIMNKTAVALAADSAVTIGGQGRQKIFNTVNKLFTLSKYHPVAVMIFGRAEIKNVPWEIIIKSYRSKLGRHRFSKLRGYADDFLLFLEKQRALFPAAQQEQYFATLVSACYRQIKRQIEEEVKERLTKLSHLKTSEVTRITDEEIGRSFDELAKLKNLRGFRETFGAQVVRKHRKVLEDLRKGIFQKLPISAGSLAKLKRIAAWLFVRDRFLLSRNSGLVFAGYGESDVFPSVTAFLVEGVIEKKLRCLLVTDRKVSLKTSAYIMPFAQSEVVQGFLDGIDPGMEKLIRKFLGEVFSQYPIALLSHIPSLSAARRNALAAKLSGASQTMLRKFDKELGRFQRETLIDPVLATVDVLPKDELAAMAESLVNLTSFKRRFSMDAETVGGPIDVAVISKGDGFVWIKRKYYFTKDLNPQFLTNYYQDA